MIDRIYDAHDNLTLNVLLNPDGSTTREVLAGVAEGIRADMYDEASAGRLKKIFAALFQSFLAAGRCELRLQRFCLKSPTFCFLTNRRTV